MVSLSFFVPSSSAPADVGGGKSVQYSSTKVAPSAAADPVKHNADADALILDVNPEEDMQTIYQLLELQHQDQKL